MPTTIGFWLDNRATSHSATPRRVQCLRGLGGGAPRSLRSDNLGKTLGASLLRLVIDVPAAVAANASRRPAPIDRTGKAQARRLRVC